MLLSHFKFSFKEDKLKFSFHRHFKNRSPNHVHVINIWKPTNKKNEVRIQNSDEKKKQRLKKKKTTLEL